jgi:hypothetical protein
LRLADSVSVSRESLTICSKVVLLIGGQVMTTTTEVCELLSTNPTISVYRHGLLDENMNVLRVGCSEEDQISHLVIEVFSCESGGAMR